MREYLLYSQIPAAREEQVLSILAGICSNQPTKINEQVLLYAQLKAQEAAVSKRQPQAKPAAAQPLGYHRLVRAYDVNNDAAVNVQPWTFRAESVPDTGITACTSRSLTSQLASKDQLSALQQPQLYHLKRQYIQSGSRFINNNLVIKLIRFYSHPAADPTSSTTQDPLSGDPQVPGQLKLVDVSGSFIIEVSIIVEDASNAQLCDSAVKELVKFKGLLDGAIDLIAPDRLLLDTRVKGLPQGVKA